MKFKFNIGDRVRVLDGSKIKDYTGGWCMKDTIGKEGVITDQSIIESHPFYTIRFDDRKFNIYESCIFDERGLELVDSISNLQFWIDGRTVHCEAFFCDFDKKVMSEATCHPEDKFDLKTGINIAVDRLLAKISLYNGKVVCVESDGPVKFSFTKGKIYTIANGEIKDDEGKTPFKNIKSLDQFNKIKGLSFIPLVE